jgi:hypothetical protein
VNDKGKRVFYWAEAGNPSTIHVFTKQIVPASVGGVYLFHETDGGGSVYTKGKYAPTYLRQFDQKDLVHVWAAQEEQAKQQLALNSLMLRAAKIEPLEDVLATLRRIARDLKSVERRALLSRIAEEIFGAGR